MTKGAIGAQPDRRGFSVLTFLALAVLVPLLITRGGVGEGYATPWLALAARYAIIVYGALRLSTLIGRGEPRWFVTMFWLFGYVWMGLAGMVQLLAHRNPFGYLVDPNSDLKSSLVVLTGLAVADVAYFLSQRRSNTKEPRVRYVSPRAVMVLSWAAAFATPVLLLQQGGLDTYLQSRAEVTQSLSSAGLVSDQSLALGGLVRAATQVPPLAALLGIIACFRFYPPLRHRPAWWVTAAVIVGLNVLVSNPVGASRFWFGTVLLGCLFILPVFQRPNGYRALVAGLLVALTVVFPYADYFRLEGGFAQERQPVSAFMVSKLDYDASAQVTYAIGLHDERGADYGHQVLGAVGFAVPRAVWENKARPTGEVLAEYSGFHFTNLSAPLWAEGFIALGFLGVAALFALFGLVMGRGDRAVLTSLRRGELLIGAILIPPLAAYSLIVLRGSLLAAAGQGVTLVVVLWLLGQRKRPELHAALGSRAQSRLEEWKQERETSDA